MKLVRAMQQGNHGMTHVLVLEKGKHGALIKGQDGLIYRNVVHAFWKYYGRPHNAEWAAAGCDKFLETFTS